MLVAFGGYNGKYHNAVSVYKLPNHMPQAAPQAAEQQAPQQPQQQQEQPKQQQQQLEQQQEAERQPAQANAAQVGDWQRCGLPHLLTPSAACCLTRPVMVQGW
jgi:hypothetical protein